VIILQQSFILFCVWVRHKEQENYFIHASCQRPGCRFRGKVSCESLLLYSRCWGAATSIAVAKDLKEHEKTNAPPAAATQMSDSDMDKVTAAGLFTPGFQNLMLHIWAT
jgi:hypothetical protein